MRFFHSRVDTRRVWCDVCRPLDPIQEGQGSVRNEAKCTCRRIPFDPFYVSYTPSRSQLTKPEPRAATRQSGRRI